MRTFITLLVAFQVVYLALGAVPLPIELIKKAFEKFKIDFKKRYYSPLEELQALKRFIVIYRLIDEHNKKFAANAVDFSLAINQFADLTAEQLKDAITGNFLPSIDLSNITVRPKEIIDIGPGDVEPGPSTMDWRKLGVVTPVKDQGYTCASCWAFSTVAAYESALAIKTGTLRNGSEQNLIDCNYDRIYGNFGCRGGNVDTAYLYTQFQPGLASGESYPYIYDQPKTSRFSCRFNQTDSIGENRGLANITPLNETLLKDVVGTMGPVTTAMNSDYANFYLYGSGVFNDEECPPGISHSVTIVGYGTARYKDGRVVDYWLVKNSWSDSWGEKGYFRIARGKNLCGIEKYLTIPLV